MKTRNPVSTIIVLVILMVGVLASQGWSQSSKVIPKTVDVRKQVQEFKAGVDIPKASDVLKKVVDDIENKRVPSQIYPPGYFDYLYSMGDNLIPFWADPMMMDSEPEDPWGEEVPIYEYQMFDIGTLGGSNCFGMSINSAGKIVGYSETSSSNIHAFVYHNGQMQDLGTSGGGNRSEAYDINDLGQIVGFFQNSSAQDRAFLYSNNTMHDLGVPEGGSFSLGYGINNSGQVVGYAGVGGGYAHAFLYSNASIVDLGTIDGGYSSAEKINNLGQAVGWSYINGSQAHAVLYQNGLKIDLGTLGGYQSSATDINEQGKIVGHSQPYEGNIGVVHPFLYFDGVMYNLGTFGGSYGIATSINNSGQVVGLSMSATGSARAFICSNGTMYDLNDLVVNPISGWILNSAHAINDDGQIVCTSYNAQGYTHTFLLKPLPAGFRNTMETQAPQPCYQGCLEKGEGKDSLVVVTHGWQLYVAPVFPPDVSWVDDMSDAIGNYFTNHNLNTWQVYGYKWVDDAWKISPDDALDNAASQGQHLGKCLSEQGWSHIHLIGHSAGGNLIQSACDIIKSNSPNTTVHLTFLDAFVGFDYHGLSVYGTNADWADSYYSRDLTVDGVGIWKFTEGSMRNTHNVNVTYVSPDKHKVAKFLSQEIGQIDLCLYTVGKHSWPHDFYLNTITNVNLPGEYQGLGFPLSLEGGGWGSITNHPTGNTIPVVLGTPDADCSNNLSLASFPLINMLVNLIDLPAIKSITGLIEMWTNSVSLTSGSPAWVASVITPTNQVNFVSFDAHFTSTNNQAEGLLSVIWDTNSIGSIDERIVGSETRSYRYTFPRASAGTSHILGFRLDPFTNIQSSVIVTNIVLGQIGVSQPFTISNTTNTVNGFKVLELRGELGYEYTIQASTNLTNWTDIAILANTNGVVRFYDQDSTNNTHRFYRGVAPY